MGIIFDLIGFKFNTIEMKNSKLEQVEIKNDKNKVSTKTKKSIKNIIEPSEDDIRKKANEIYLQRLESDEYGTPESDWDEAKRILAESLN
jgi:hypothetical protein